MLVSLRALLVPVVLAGVGAGCSVAEMARDVAGIDTSPIAPGVGRGEVEARLGAPAKSWVSEHGVSYALYAFDIGIPPNSAAAAATLFMDVATAGLWELFWALDEDLRRGIEETDRQRETGWVLVSYDDQDVVLGLFDQYDALPADGRSERRPEVFAR